MAKKKARQKTCPQCGRNAADAPKNHRPRRTAETGVIRADEVLTIDAFCARFKVTRNHIVDIRRKGLIVRLESEKNLRIVGADYIQFLLTMPNAVPRPREEESPM